MADGDPPKERIQLSVAQIAASCLAAVTAAVLCSFFGVAGTVIGTALASLFATVGSTLYAHSLRRTQARLRRLHQAGAAAPPLTEVVKTARQQGQRWFGQIHWRAVGVGTGAVFLVSLAVITIIELSAGETLSKLFGVSHSGGRGTSIASITSPHHHHHSSTPSPSTTPTSTSPSPTPTKTATVKPTPSPTPRPRTSSPAPSQSPSNILSTLLPPASSSASG